MKLPTWSTIWDWACAAFFLALFTAMMVLGAYFWAAAIYNFCHPSHRQSILDD